ncbi:hypothetical protein DKG34_25055 [Streptomyces sp. NWU49]|nr:hypothetical protein DKG34_25055 [Streptomyces sp. NWU49]
MAGAGLLPAQHPYVVWLMQILRDTHDTTLLRYGDHHQDHKQRSADEGHHPPAQQSRCTTVSSTTKSSGASSPQASCFPQPASYSDHEPYEHEVARADCFESHLGADGYVDCDGKPV